MPYQKVDYPDLDGGGDDVQVCSFVLFLQCDHDDD
jgi:hypothetical protein